MIFRIFKLAAVRHLGCVCCDLDHPRRPIEIPLGTVGGFPAVTISLKFHQLRLSGYRAVRGRNLADFGRSRYLRQPLIQQPFKIDKLKRVVASEVIAPGTSRPAEPHFTGLALNNLSCVTLDEVSKILTSIPAKSSPLDFIPTSLRKQCNMLFAEIIARLANMWPLPRITAIQP